MSDVSNEVRESPAFFAPDGRTAVMQLSAQIAEFEREGIYDPRAIERGVYCKIAGIRLNPVYLQNVIDDDQRDDKSAQIERNEAREVIQLWGIAVKPDENISDNRVYFSYIVVPRPDNPLDL